MLKLTILLIVFRFCVSCPEGTIASFSNPASCYLFVSNKAEFINAEGYCQQQGGHLTSVSNAFDNMFLSQKASLSFQDSTESDFWLGATNELIPGQWSWMDGTSFEYTDLEKGQPANTSTSNCAASYITSSLWTAVDCFKIKNFVCLIVIQNTSVTTTTARPPTTWTKSTTTTTTTKPVYCEDGWKYYDETGFCYKALSNFNISWEGAEKYCLQNYNIHLASIHSQTEADFVADLARGSLSRIDYQPCNHNQCWIGLYTVTNNTVWLWADETSFNYQGWSPEEPNYPGQENCVQVMLNHCGDDDANDWNNIECSQNTKNFVCKKSHL